MTPDPDGNTDLHPELTAMAPDQLEPLDDWVHVQPSADDEKKGRIYLPAGVGDHALQRSMVLAVGDEVVGVRAGDVVFILGNEAIDLRDGSRLVQRHHVVAKVDA